MKKVFLLTALLMTFIIYSTSAVAANWTAVTDEVEVDFSTNFVQIFAVVKESNNANRDLRDSYRKIILSYIGSLTMDKERTPLKDVFVKRPALYAKVQQLVENKYDAYGNTNLPATKQVSQYFTFDLNLLTSVLPELNFPTKEDSL